MSRLFPFMLLLGVSISFAVSEITAVSTRAAFEIIAPRASTEVRYPRCDLPSRQHNRVNIETR